MDFAPYSENIAASAVHARPRCLANPVLHAGKAGLVRVGSSTWPASACHAVSLTQSHMPIQHPHRKC
eukprot:6825855-Heterocapsa_arctica.AAC.1